MSTRVRLAAALIALTGTLTSCTIGPPPPSPPALDSVAGQAGAPAGTASPTPAGKESAAPQALTPGAPIPDAELAGSPTAKQMRFIAGRLDAYLAANGVPANWASGAAGEDCWSRISVIYTQAEQDAWNDDIQTPYTCSPDGSYKLSGWSQSGSDPKFKDANSSLQYESGKGFVAG